MREPIYTGRFKRDVRKMKQRNFDMEELRAAIRLLLSDAPLPKHFKDHALKGKWASFRDLHIAPDWVLIYKKEGDAEILFARTGTHADIFG
jgi:mRNA interferase YafQ